MKTYDNVIALLESEETRKLFEGKEELINEANNIISNFPEILSEIVCIYPNEFLGSNIDETVKNIRVFAEAATAQFICEITQIYADAFPVQIEEEKRNILSDYL